MSPQDRLPLYCLFRALLELKRAPSEDSQTLASLVPLHEQISRPPERRHLSVGIALLLRAFVLLRLYLLSCVRPKRLTLSWFPRGHTGKGRERTSKHLSSSGKIVLGLDKRIQSVWFIC